MKPESHSNLVSFTINIMVKVLLFTYITSFGYSYRSRMRRSVSTKSGKVLQIYILAFPIGETSKYVWRRPRPCSRILLLYSTWKVLSYSLYVFFSSNLVR